jgi:hypothetical protein
MIFGGYAVTPWVGNSEAVYGIRPVVARWCRSENGYELRLTVEKGKVKVGYL